MGSTGGYRIFREVKREVGPAEVQKDLDCHRAAGFHVDRRLLHEVGQPGKMFMGPMRTLEEFFALVWQSICETRPLAPVRQPRTVRDCAFRLSQFEWSFRTLVDRGYSWFQTCVEIDESFDYSSFGWIALTPLNNHERQETPVGTYLIYDGVHKSIVLGKKLLRREIEYMPLEALLLTPRRS